jgi:hypothetical protein
MAEILSRNKGKLLETCTKTRQARIISRFVQDAKNGKLNISLNFFPKSANPIVREIFLAF